MIEFAFYGLLGGIVRALVGITKAMKKKRFRFNNKRFFFTLISSAIIGAFVALLMSPDYRLALFAGYAGTDLLEGLVKLKVKKW